MALAPCTISSIVVSGPTNQLSEKKVLRHETSSRIRACNEEINREVKNKSYLNQDKTPTAVKVTAGTLLLVGVWKFLKNKFKK